ncbi:unnamed protein product [Kuraishia capsulata CBS 1993]|uniref:Mediator of RNA polymerase II transcription subunit 5 n=1 Tax=Kuraishia capsulata CBS 1993 TaxID=1382522 RepID=W6MY50_9ASCO|nr:uncharacterized protein KUCA_T00006015001 [Kuraishia capsulata CBS 1993]CDK30020.1 unnamed protein product [Kuraishia capsulata CBS 1993]
MPLEVNDFIQQCLARAVPPDQFHRLLKELSRTAQFDLKDLSGLYTDVSPESEYGLLRLEYILELISEESFPSVLFGILPGLKQKDQFYTLAALAQKSCGSQLDHHILSGFVDHLEKVPFDTDIATVLVTLVNQCGDEALAARLAEYLSRHAPHLTVLLDQRVKDDVQPGTLLGNRLNAKLVRLRKLLWLSHQVNVRYVPLVAVEAETQFVNEFKQILRISQALTGSTNTMIASELLTSLFECYVADPSPVWEEFILFKFPLLVKRSLKTNQDTLEEVIHNCFETLSTAHSLKVDLIKCLIRLELVKQSAAKRFGLIAEEPVDAVEDLVSVHADFTTPLGSAFKEQFVDANPEFVAFDEADPLSLVDQMASGSVYQRRNFALMVSHSVHRFIREKDSARLHRLLLVLSTNLSVLCQVVLATGPYQFVLPLVQFLETWELDKQRNQDQDQDQMLLFGQEEDDDVNFQDYYTDFSCVLLVVFYVFQKFDLRLEMLLAHSASQNASADPTFVFDFLKRSMGLPQPASRRDLQDPSSNLNKLVNDWINSLFDSDVAASANGGGISDELIKSSSMRDCFKVIPVVFQEAIIAHTKSFLGDEPLMNGLEYFLQPFLVCTIVGIFDFVRDRLWELCDVQSGEVALILKLVQSLVAPGTKLKGEALYMHILVLETSSRDLCTSLRPYISENTAIRQLVEKYDKPSNSNLEHSFFSRIRHICDAEAETWDLRSLFPLVELVGLSATIEEFLTRCAGLGLDSPAGSTMLEIGSMVLVSYLLCKCGALNDESKILLQLDELTKLSYEDLEKCLVKDNQSNVLIEEDEANNGSNNDDEDDKSIKEDTFGRRAFDSGFMGMLKTENEMEEEELEMTGVVKEESPVQEEYFIKRYDQNVLEFVLTKYEAWKAEDDILQESFDKLMIKIMGNSGTF